MLIFHDWCSAYVFTKNSIHQELPLVKFEGNNVVARVCKLKNSVSELSLCFVQSVIYYQWSDNEFNSTKIKRVVIHWIPTLKTSRRIKYKKSEDLQNATVFSCMHNAWIWSMNDDYLATSVVIVNVVPVWLLPSSMKESMSKDLLSVKKPGSFGWGKATPSLLNIRSTDGIAGLSFGSFWTHKRPTWMHLSTSNSTYESSKQGSISSKPLSLFHSSQAWKSCKLYAFQSYTWKTYWRFRISRHKLTHKHKILTCPRRMWLWSGWWNPLFFLPLIISNKITPKLKTSDFIENLPSIAYSGDK